MTVEIRPVPRRADDRRTCPVALRGRPLRAPRRRSRPAEVARSRARAPHSAVAALTAAEDLAGVRRPRRASMRGRYNLPVRFDQPADVTIVARRARAARRHGSAEWRPAVRHRRHPRARAGVAPLDPPTVRRIGAAIVKVLEPRRSPPATAHRPRHARVRRLDRARAGARRPAGRRRLSRRSASCRRRPSRISRAARDVTLGAVISASHNPFEDNGIKVFSGAGHKFTEELERQVEADRRRFVVARRRHEAPPVAEVDRSEAYLAHLRDQLDDPGPLRGAKLVVDCANGATTHRGGPAFPQPRFRRHADRRFARRTQHQPAAADRRIPRRWRTRVSSSAARSPAWRSTATATARSSPTSTAARRRRRRDADVRAAAEGRGPPARQHRRRHRDEQHRPRAGARRIRHRAAAHAGRRQVRDGGAAARRLLARAASSPATSSSRTTCSPAMALRLRSACCA